MIKKWGQADWLAPIFYGLSTQWIVVIVLLLEDAVKGNKRIENRISEL